MDEYLRQIIEIELGVNTLLSLFLLPITFYLTHSAWWYRPKQLRFTDFLITLGSILALFSVMLKGRTMGRYGWNEEMALVVAHMIPPALALFAVFSQRRVAYAVYALASSGGGPRRNSPEPVSTPPPQYQPQKINRQVEQIGWEQIVVDPSVREELETVVKLLKNPMQAKQYGLEVPKGILFSGPPGTGKTTIARVVASTAGLAFFALRADEVFSKWVGESEKNLSSFFQTAQASSPAVIFIDEIDAIGKRRSATHSTHGDNLLNHLLQLIDGIVKTDGLYVIGATNRAELVDEALKRAGRLNRVIEIGVPDAMSRLKLFSLYAGSLRLSADVDLSSLVKATDGRTPADVRAICNHAGMIAFRRCQQPDASGRPRDFRVTMDDFASALRDFKVDLEELDDSPEGHAVGAGPQPMNPHIEKVGWDDLIIDTRVKQEIQAVVALVRDNDSATRYGIEVPKGILLSGPPGTGKTTIAKVIASTAGLSFFVLQTSDILSKWVGESEKNLSRLFKAATKHAPSAIFIDELDSLAKNRAEGNAQHADNLLNHLLQLIDGVIRREGIYIIGATNRVDLVDPALKRGGRLNRIIEIPVPDSDSRKALFGLYLKKLRIPEIIDYEALAAATEGRSAADIKSICNQAGVNAFQRENLSGNKQYMVRAEDVYAAADVTVHGLKT